MIYLLDLRKTSVSVWQYGLAFDLLEILEDFKLWNIWSKILRKIKTYCDTQ